MTTLVPPRPSLLPVGPDWPQLHLQQASRQFSDRLSRQAEDLDVILSRQAHVTGFTETGTHELAKLVRRKATEHGMRFVDGKGDGCFAVRRDLQVLDRGSVFVNPGETGKPGRAHGPRYVVWVKLGWRDEVVFVNEAHWLTGSALGPTRRRMHVDMTKAVVNNVKAQARGRRLAFWMGDTNIDEQGRRSWYDPLIEDGRLLSCWDEVGKYPPTHEKVRRTIDIVGSYDPDRRVRLVRVDLHPDREQHTWTDHAQVSAFYAIKPRRAT